jgi:hypothetical protein
MNRASFWPRPVATFGLVVLVIAVSGCGRQTGKISGTITHKDGPVKGGTISFVSLEGQPTVSGPILENGFYNIEKINVGACKVVIETESINRGKTTGGGFNKGPKGPPPGVKANQTKDAAERVVPEGYHIASPEDVNSAKMAERYVKIPEKYGKADTTDLTYTVVAGPQTKDFDLP